MFVDKDFWLNNVKTVAETFIKANYSKELPLFDTFWTAFAYRINDEFKTAADNRFTGKPISQLITEISFIKENSLDLMTPVILGTITEIMLEVRTKKLSVSELKKSISSVAAKYGAKPSLSACLIRNLPQLCNELLSCKENVSEAVVSNALLSRYRIWTEGKNMTVDNLDKYEKNRNKYLFWIDLREKSHISNVSQESRIGLQAVNLLTCLVENIGTILSKEDVFKEGFRSGLQ